MEKALNKSKGITLVALVITIIVLLILAGVSIATLAGDNGILTRANQAKTENERATMKEKRKLAQAEARTNLKETIYKDKNLEEIKIPARMAVPDIEGENTLQEGIVTIDQNGNEWVWIEVPKSETAAADTDDKIYQALNTYSQKYRWGFSSTDMWYDGCGLEEEEYNKLKSKMLNSIKNNGGFWISRYEIGTDKIRVNSSDPPETPFSQEDKYPYNKVTISQAQERAEALNATIDKDTSLLFGIQWDLVLKYIESKNAKTEEEIKNDCTSWGNYINASFKITKGKYSINYSSNVYQEVEGEYEKAVGAKTILTTGATKRNSVLNIYDLASNVREWTLERYNTDLSSPCIGRGAYAELDGRDRQVTYRSTYPTTSDSVVIGFRVALY